MKKWTRPILLFFLLNTGLNPVAQSQWINENFNFSGEFYNSGIYASDSFLYLVDPPEILRRVNTEYIPQIMPEEKVEELWSINVFKRSILISYLNGKHYFLEEENPNFQETNLPGDVQLISAIFLDSIYLASYGNGLYVSNDGIDWTLRREIIDGGFYNSSHSNLTYFNNRLWALGAQGLYWSGDNGKTFELYASAPFEVYEKWGDYRVLTLSSSDNYLYVTWAREAEYVENIRPLSAGLLRFNGEKWESCITFKDFASWIEVKSDNGLVSLIGAGNLLVSDNEGDSFKEVYNDTIWNSQSFDDTLYIAKDDNILKQAVADIDLSVPDYQTLPVPIIDTLYQTNNGIEIQWSADQGNHTKFIIERLYLDGMMIDYEPIATVNSSVKRYRDTSLIIGNTATIRYRIVAVLGELRSFPSNEVTLENAVTSIEKSTPSPTGVYPNPSSSKVTILTEVYIHKLQLFDLHGREVFFNYSISGKKGIIDLTYASPNTYLIKIIDKKGRETVQKVVRY